LGRISTNTPRYLQLFADAAGSLLEENIIMATADLEEKEDVIDVLVSNRTALVQAMEDNEAGSAANLPELPKALTRRFDVRILPLSTVKPVALREVRPDPP
jgi:hypothetical protein